MTTWHRLALASLAGVAVLVFAGAAPRSASSPGIHGPLRVHPQNRRYFTDDSGKAIYLTGSHTWNNFKEMGPTDPPAAFDFDAYLDFLEKHHHNFIRLWTWELTRYAYGGKPTYAQPFPWPRSGPGNGLDGGPKFDLSKFNPAYFERLLGRVEAAGRRGIYVSVMLFEGHGLHASDAPWCWDGHPLNAANNLQGISGDPNGDGRGLETQSLQVPAVTLVQEAYVRKVLDTLGNLDNVLYEIVNESGAYSTEWQYHFIRFIHEHENRLPKQHPVGMTFQFARDAKRRGTNAALFAGPADWISPNPDGGYRDNPPAADGTKVILTDTDHLWGIGGNAQWVWKSFCRGLNPIFMDPYSRSETTDANGGKRTTWTDHLAGPPQLDPKWDPVRRAMGQTRRFAVRMNLAATRPENRLASSGYCLAHAADHGSAAVPADAEYLAYLPDGGEVTVDLSASPGKLAVEWFNPAQDRTVPGGEVQGGASRTLKAPFEGDAVLYLNATAPQVGLGAETNTTPNRLRVGVVQMALGQTIADNRDRIATWIARAASRGVRVVVFPEAALGGKDGDDPALVDEAVAAIRRAARDHRVYVLCGGASYWPRAKRDVCWMFVAGPDGRDVFRYDKLYDKHDAKMPGVFHVDGIPCGTMICADRWLRGVEEIPIQQGAQISFELSCNFASEWVAPLEWYWYVPRALRNNVWVVFANAGNKLTGVSDTSSPRELRHGHSAIIAPDGRIVAAAHGDTETIVVADLDLRQATRAEALSRAAHPVLRPFWEAGLKLHGGQAVEAPAVTPLKSAETEITIAAAQVANDLSAMEGMIDEARAKNADLVAFPERAISETALGRLQAAARKSRITVVVGMEHRADGAPRNSAFVIGPDGSLLTRYDQLSATNPYLPGADAGAMWFRVNGVPAVVTIGRDALWSELAELAAVAGAQLHVHLDHEPLGGRDAELRRLQVWSNLASFQTFSATVNVVGSAIWDALRDMEERHAEVRGLPRPDTGPVEVYSPFSANLVVRAGARPELISATRRVGPRNLYHPHRTSNFNPQMDAWYRLGAEVIHPK